LGKEYTLRFIDRSENYIEIYEDFIVIASPASVSKEIAQSALTGWLTHKAKDFLPQILNKYLQIMSNYELNINTLYIRPMTTRWGTCHKIKKVITLNSYLMQEPLPFIEYVVLHELCHLKYANHSKRFYDFVAEFMPDWRERRKMRNRNIEEE
jgi:predicted metal-dependent hydrolase